MDACTLVGAGIRCAVGLDATAAACAIRGGISGIDDTAFRRHDAPVPGAEKPLTPPLRGRARLGVLAAAAIAEAFAPWPASDLRHVPLFLCVAEPARAGRIDGLDEEFLRDVLGAIGGEPHPGSVVVPGGRTGIAFALRAARELIAAGTARYVLVAGADTHLTAPGIDLWDRHGLLRRDGRGDGWVPGDGAAAVLLGPGDGPRLAGIGIAGLDPAAPDPAAATAAAWRAAHAEAGWAATALDWRLADLGGRVIEQDELALAAVRVLRGADAPERIPLWLPQASVGNAGAALGPLLLALVQHAWRRGVSPGRRAAIHLAEPALDGRATILFG